MQLHVTEHGFRSVACPLIGTGSGSGSADYIQHLITDKLATIEFPGVVYVVRYINTRHRG